MIQLTILCVFVSAASAFHSGAPPEACIFGRPNHWGTEVSTSQSPYHIKPGSVQYRPGETVSVEIRGGEKFKGFFIQAHDPKTGKSIGYWRETPRVKTHNYSPYCVGVTHTDPLLKKRVLLEWEAGPRDSGHVKFSGIVLKSFTKYWFVHPRDD